jgi:hypothetical protein
MWEVRNAPSKGTTNHDNMMIDASRDVWIQPIGVTIGDPGRVFKLVGGDNVIPFDTIEESQRDEEGKEYILVKFHSFGGSPFAAQYGVETYRFRRDEERRQAMMLAAEALIAFGSDYDGARKPEGFYRVEYEGQIFTAGSFGFP